MACLHTRAACQVKDKEVDRLACQLGGAGVAGGSNARVSEEAVRRMEDEVAALRGKLGLAEAGLRGREKDVDRLSKMVREEAGAGVGGGEGG